MDQVSHVSLRYFQGVFWVLLVSLISNSNDILMRLLGSRLPSMEISFFRFLFAMITILPIMILKGKDSFKSGFPKLQVTRALMGFIAISLWCYAVGITPLSVVSTVALTVPLFVLPMAKIFLKERVGWQRTLATISGFCGIMIIVWPKSSGALEAQQGSYGALLLILAAILFAASDILNKKMVSVEGSMAMLFYFALGTSIAGIIPTIFVWVPPNMYELALLFCLGVGGNLILFCLLKAFACVEVSALAPYRYTELLFAGVFGFIFFGETPHINTLFGIAIIIPSTFMIAVYENKQLAKPRQAQVEFQQ